MRRPVPVIVVLASIGITLRTLFALLSGSTFVYLFQPVVGKLVLSAVLWASIATGTPLVARFAHDFCSISPDVESRPAIISLYRRLTHLWAGVNLVIAGLGFLLLRTVPFSTFVAVKPVMAFVLTSCAVALDCRRLGARRRAVKVYWRRSLRTEHSRRARRTHSLSRCRAAHQLASAKTKRLTAMNSTSSGGMRSAG